MPHTRLPLSSCAKSVTAVSANANDTEFVSGLQSGVTSPTPPVLGSRPTSAGKPATTISLYSAPVGRTSVIVTANGDHTSLTHWTTFAHSPVCQAYSVKFACLVTSTEVSVFASSAPGRIVQ